MTTAQIHYPLASSSWDEAELNAIQKVIATGNYTMGQHVAQFEKDFALKFDSRYAVMVNSGSSANLLAIAALFYKKEKPLHRGDEVIVPSLSWSTTFFPVSQYGLKLVFVDIDLSTLNIDVTQLEAALSEKTRAVFVPNILGNPADLVKIKQFCDAHDLYLIEDNCESMGATINNKQAGTFGICGTFSTFFSHHIATMEGGVIATDDIEFYHLLLSLRSHGWTRHLPEKNELCIKSPNPFYESFRFILPGYNFRPVEMSGAVGVEQLKKLDGFIAARRENAQHFQKLFSNSKFILQQENGKSSWFGFSFILKNGSIVERDNYVKQLQHANIAVRPIVTGNFLKNEALKWLDYRIVGEHKNSQQADQCGFFVGNHHYPIFSELNHLAEVLSI